MRLKDKVAVIIGAGQSPGEGLGNGRATAMRFAHEGARVLASTATSSLPRRRRAMAAPAATPRPSRPT